MKRVWIVKLLLFTSFFVLLTGSFAAAEELTMKADVGFDGSYLLDQWTPVNVSIENTGSNIDGRLEVTVHNESGRSVIYAVPAAVPNSSSKEYTIYVKISSLVRSLEISLRDDKGKLVKTITASELNPVSRDRYFLGLVTDDEPSLGYWKERMNGNYLLSNYHPVALTSKQFPVQKDILDSFSVIIVNNIDTDSWNEDQIAALNNWVENGGVLIAGTGLNGRRVLAGLAGNVIPVRAGDITDLPDAASLEAIVKKPLLGDVPLSVMDLQSDSGKVLVEQDGKNLVLYHQKGQGHIYTAAFDIGTEPIISWVESKQLWENLLTDSLPEMTANYLRSPYSKYNESSGMEEVLGYIKAMGFPSVAAILFIFLLYLAFAGPLNYIVLKKVDKREWSWFTIPAISIIFAVAIYGLGYSAKGGDLILNTVSVVDMNSDAKSARVTDYAGIFFPKPGDYRVQVDNDVLLTLNNQSNYGLYGTEPVPKGIIEAEIIQGRPSQVLFNNVNIWTMKTFRTSERQMDFGSIDASLYYSDGKIRGTIENNTPYPLEDFTLYTPYVYAKAGNIAAGEKKNVEMLIPVQTTAPYYSSIYYNMLDDIYPYPATVSGTDKSNEIMVRRRIIEIMVMNAGSSYVYVRPTLPYPGPNAMPSGSTGLTLNYFAFIEGASQNQDITINGKKPDVTFSRGFVKGTLDFDLQKDGYISIPPGMISGRFEPDMSKNAEYGKDIIFIRDFRDYAVFSVDLTPYMDMKELKAQISMSIFGGQGQVLIYDLEQQEYADAGGTVINIDEGNMDRYVDVDGDIYIKVMPEVDQYIEVGLPTVALEGRPE